MAITHTPEVLAQLEAQALSIPHQLFLVDRALKVDVGAFVSHVTLGNTNPNGQINAVATLTLSTETMLSLAATLLEAVRGQSSQIKSGHAAFQKNLGKA